MKGFVDVSDQMAAYGIQEIDIVGCEDRRQDGQTHSRDHLKNAVCYTGWKSTETERNGRVVFSTRTSPNNGSSKCQRIYRAKLPYVEKLTGRSSS